MKLTSLRLPILVVSMLASSVRAQPGGAPERVAVAPSPRDEKSPGVARTLSVLGGVGGVLAGFAVTGMLWNAFDDDDEAIGDGAATVAVGAGLVVAGLGPSMGHFYAGETTHGVVVSGLRIAAGTAAMLSIATDADDERVILGGIVVALALDVYDLFDAPDAARRANAKARAATGPTVGLVPMPLRAGAGAALVGAF